MQEIKKCISLFMKEKKNNVKELPDKTRNDI